MGFWHLLGKSFRSWKEDKAPQLAASTAYYTVFSLAPVLLIVTTLAGLFVDTQVVREAILGQGRALIGEQGAETIHSFLESTSRSPATPFATVMGFLILAFGASGLMMALQDALNFIWKVRTKRAANKFLIILLKRFLSLGMILTIGFLLLVSLIISAVISALLTFLAGRLPVAVLAVPLELTLSLAILTLLFAVLFKYLPDIQIKWRTVWPGALCTAILFTLGKFLLGYYLGHKDFSSTYGVAASVIIILLWVNYSAQILFFGAEFTKAYAEETGSIVQPKHYAQFIDSSAARKEDRKPSHLYHLGVILRVLLVEGKMGWKIWQLKRKWKKK